LRLLKRAGCFKMLIGVESVNPAALREYRKSQTVGLIRQSIEAIAAEGLRAHSMFVLGADSDDEASIDATIRFSLVCVQQRFLGQRRRMVSSHHDALTRIGYPDGISDAVRAVGSVSDGGYTDCVSLPQKG
jgi:hypothetical protein